ncbi:MAG: glutamate ABC transporter substrate-binding protein [Solirubrobacterales bacterium]|nr:glutamate ABC transporter substrate-binding protein [Solirubrobacterales bacterium]
MKPPRRHLLAVVLLAALAATLAGCGASTDHAEKLTLMALATPEPQAKSSPPGPATLCTASLRPPASMPAPGTMPAGSFMAKIRRRGYLIAGVNAGLLDFGYLNPGTGKLEGFEIDLVREIARAIFGNPNAVRLVALTVPQREPFVEQGNVDIVVDAVTMTCKRSQKIDFSTEYYDAKQRVLVPSNSPAGGIADLAGKKVCASAGSTPIYVMQHLPYRLDVVGGTQAIDCLVALQQGRVDAISTDSSILLGFQAQDPNTKIVGSPLADVPYGAEINKSHPEFVRFVNGVLAELRANGTWSRLYSQWLHQFGATPAPPQPQYDG